MTAEFYVSLQYTGISPQLVPPSAWTTLWLDTLLDQPSSGDWLAGVAAPGPWSLVRPPAGTGSRKGTHASGYAHWGLVAGEGLLELGASKTGLRLCRNPDTAPNSTCTDKRAVSGGLEYHGGWGHQLTAKTADAWALQVWHDAAVPVPLVAAEFKVTVP
jgi:hypothetical protein